MIKLSAILKGVSIIAKLSHKPQLQPKLQAAAPAGLSFSCILNLTPPPPPPPPDKKRSNLTKLLGCRWGYLGLSGVSWGELGVAGVSVGELQLAGLAQPEPR